MGSIVVAVAGQPNSGKSTLFNMLTGIRQFVANYPGVTVEKRVGHLEYGGHGFTLVDLPGTYSLTSYSLEERIARDFLLHEKPDLILNVVDASNLERNLVFTFQLMEMGLSITIALNMMDVAENKGMKIDVERLAQELGIRVVPTVAKKGIGKLEICQALLRSYELQDGISSFRPAYSSELTKSLKTIEQMLKDDSRSLGYNPHWLAVRLLAGDEEVRQLFAGQAGLMSGSL